MRLSKTKAQARQFKKKGQNTSNEFLNRFFQSLSRVITSLFCKCKAYMLKSLPLCSRFYWWPIEVHFRTEKPCRSIYSNPTQCSWVVINPVIAHCLPGIILLIMTICLTLLCPCMSICPLHVLGGKDLNPSFERKIWKLIIKPKQLCTITDIYFWPPLHSGATYFLGKFTLDKWYVPDFKRSIITTPLL